MGNQFVPALRMLVALTIVTGVAYPLVVTVIAQALFRRQAEGSLIERDGKVVGSELVSQKFESDRYFWSRPSAGDYNPLPSGGSNLGSTSKALKERVEATKAKIGADAPQDLVFASASGLDPHITPEAALYQIARVAKARGLPEDQLRSLVGAKTEGLQLGFLGERRVNVLALNLELDRMQPKGP